MNSGKRGRVTPSRPNHIAIIKRTAKENDRHHVSIEDPNVRTKDQPRGFSSSSCDQTTQVNQTVSQSNQAWMSEEEPKFSVRVNYFQKQKISSSQMIFCLLTASLIFMAIGILVLVATSVNPNHITSSNYLTWTFNSIGIFLLLLGIVTLIIPIFILMRITLDELIIPDDAFLQL